jgi:endoglucanase
VFYSLGNVSMMHTFYSVTESLPDIGIAVDITPAHDYPNDLTGSNKIGKGIGIKICDPSVVADEMVVSVMDKVCEENRIPCQREVIDRGGTDASSMNVTGAGVRTGGICVVTRYPHSQSSVVAGEDIEAGIDLMNAFSAYDFSVAEDLR